MSSTNGPRPNRTPIFVALGCCVLLAVAALILAIIGGVVLLNRADDPEPTRPPATATPPSPSATEGEPTEGEPTEEGTSAAAPGGQASDPVELTVDTGTITATFGPVDWDGAEEVAAGNPYNEPAPAGQTYIVVPTTMTYSGEGEVDVYMSTHVTFVGADGGEYREASVVMERDYILAEPLADGETLEADIAYLVPEAAVGGGHLEVYGSDPATTQTVPLS